MNDIIIPGGWRDAQKEKPPNLETVIIFTKGRERWAAVWEKGKKRWVVSWWFDHMVFSEKDVLYWAPLPEPPEGM